MAAEMEPFWGQELAWSTFTALVSYAGMACFVCFSICCPWSIPISLWVRQHPHMFTAVEEDEKPKAETQAKAQKPERKKSVEVREEGFVANSEAFALMSAPQGPSESRGGGVGIRDAVLPGSPEPAGGEKWLAGKSGQVGEEEGMSLQSMYLKKENDGSPVPRKLAVAEGGKGADSPSRAPANARTNIWQRLTAGTDSPKGESSRTPKKEEQRKPQDRRPEDVLAGCGAPPIRRKRERNGKGGRGGAVGVAPPQRVQLLRVHKRISCSEAQDEVA